MACRRQQRFDVYYTGRMPVIAAIISIILDRLSQTQRKIDAQ